MKINYFTKPAKKINEDAIFACENFAFVLDGATGLLKENIFPIESDASWFTSEFKEFLANNLGCLEKTIFQIVSEGIEVVNKKYNSFEGANNVKSRPSSGLALFRINGENIEYFTLGDCSLIIRNDKNEINHLILNDLPRLDKINIEKMAQIAKEKNINVIDAREFINDDLVKTRLSQNTDNGYWILSDDKNAVNHGLYGTVPISEVKQIVGLSDGFSQIYDTFEIYTINNFMEKLYNGEKIEDLYKILFDAQNKDEFCNNFPRFKLRDDSSIFNIIFD